MKGSTLTFHDEKSLAAISDTIGQAAFDAAFFMNQFMKTNIIKKALSLIAAAFIATAANHAQAALTITNGDFQDLTGLTAQGSGWYNGVPDGWSSSSTNLNYNVINYSFGNLGANLQTLGPSSPTFTPLYQSAGLLESTGNVTLSFNILGLSPTYGMGAAIYDASSGTGPGSGGWTILTQGSYDQAVPTAQTLIAENVAAGTTIGVGFWSWAGAPGLDNVSVIPEPTALELISLPVKVGLYMVDNISKNIYTCGINPRKFNALHIVY